MMDRRAFTASTLAAAGSFSMDAFPSSVHPVEMIAAPTSLGLRPGIDGREPTTWQGADALLATSLADDLGAVVTRLDHPAYRRTGQAGTAVRNGFTIRDFSLGLAARVAASLDERRFPVVLGGDCSILLGCLVGVRRAGGRGLVHVDGHSDFFHPGNYDSAKRLGTSAGMDLALATGRGELLLTEWPGVSGPLVADADAVQIGEREAPDGRYGAYGDIAGTAIRRVLIQEVFGKGVERIASETLVSLEKRSIGQAWLHVDFDVLDQRTLRAVDSPGSPGLTLGMLGHLLELLLASGRFAGAGFAIYDPGLDPGHRHAPALAACIAHAVKRRRGR